MRVWSESDGGSSKEQENGGIGEKEDGGMKYRQNIAYWHATASNSIFNP